MAPSSPRRLRALAPLLVVLGLLVGGWAAPAEAAARPDPRRTQGLYVDSRMPAYVAGGVYRTSIGRYSQALWLGPEYYPTSSPSDPRRAVRSVVATYAGAAERARKTPVLTVYGIPGRDCGWYSSDNPLKTAAQYEAWVDQIAAGLRGEHAIVVLEPDALPLFSSSVQSCPTKPRGWQTMLRYATRRLSGAGAWVYLDAGHSAWTPYDTRPAYLRQAGVAYARGISTNVSNYRPTADEKAYATTLLRGLRKLGITGKHYVIDTSRNGAPNPPLPSSDPDKYNPYWARVGKPPRLVFDGAFDGTLWVKHPGESDGYVNGGGASGKWCAMLADRLLNQTSTSSYCP